MTPWELRRLTPWEFLLRADGHARTWTRFAALVAWIAQVNYKVDLTPEVILRGRPAAPK